MSKRTLFILIVIYLPVFAQNSLSERKAIPSSYSKTLGQGEYQINTLPEYPSSQIDNDQLRLRISDSTNSISNLNEALEKLCNAIRTSNKEVLKEFAGLTPEEILEGFTLETMPEDGPHCTNWNLTNEFNYLKSDTEYYMYAIEYGDGSGYLSLVYESDRWIAKKFVFNDEVEKLRNESKGK